MIVTAGAADRHPPNAATLRSDAQTLAARHHRALLELYAAETEVTSARLKLTALEAATERARADQALAEKQAAIARHAFSVSQAQLAERLRTLYVHGQPDPLAVVLGATSVDEALNGIEAIKQGASLNQRVIRQTSSAKTRFALLSARLAKRSARLRSLVHDGAASVAALSALRERRAGTVAALRTREELTRREIAGLESAARAAEAKTQELATSTDAPAPVAQPASSPDPATPTAADGATLTVTATGYSLPGQTATGLPVGWGVAAVDPNVIPLGTRMTVPGYGEAVAADIGSGVQGATIDLWFPTLAQARAWGRRTVVIALH